MISSFWRRNCSKITVVILNIVTFFLIHENLLASTFHTTKSSVPSSHFHVPNHKKIIFIKNTKMS
jgi:hypothetical protein